VEHDLKSIFRAALAGAQRAAISEAVKLTGGGHMAALPPFHRIDPVP
jgi:hypothetical protein